MSLYCEEHRELRGGVGKVTTYTRAVRRFIFFGRFTEKFRLIKLILHEESSIGEHVHDSSNELYITFNRNIRFNNNKSWRMFNLCRKGKSHSAQNLSTKEATIFAVKF